MGIEKNTKVIDNRNEEEYSKFEYFNLNGLPIRTVYKDGRSPIGADTVDPASGTLVKSADLIIRTLTDPHIEEISKEEFFSLCEKMVDSKN
jgi:hypothetical protein